MVIYIQNNIYYWVEENTDIFRGHKCSLRTGYPRFHFIAFVVFYNFIMCHD